MSFSRIISNLKPSTISKICGSLGAVEGFFEGVAAYAENHINYYSEIHHQDSRTGKLYLVKPSKADIIAPSFIYGGLGFFGSHFTLKIAKKLHASDVVKQLLRK